MSFHGKIKPIPTAAFTGFVFWLVAFPMSGDLLPSSINLLWFLLPHIGTLLFLGHLTKPRWFDGITSTGIWLTIVLTFVFPLMADAAEPLLVLLGVTAAPLSVRAGIGLKSTPSFRAAALVGLVGGNLLAILLVKSPLEHTVRFMLIGISLLPALFTPYKPEMLRGDTPGFFHYIGFVFAFQLVSGLMYGYLFPAYAEHGIWQGGELLFYMAGAALALKVLGYSRDLTLAAGVMLAMFAFLLLVAGNNPVILNLSMFAMMTAAGVIDLFLVAFVLSFDNTARAYGYGMVVLCGGIAAGRILSAAVGEAGNMIGFLGSMFLNIAVLALFFLEYWRRKKNIQISVTDTTSSGRITELPPWLAMVLSEREKTVLQGVLDNKIYKDIADEMGISESSVKTYMNRIYFKSGIVGKKRLISRLCKSEYGSR